MKKIPLAVPCGESCTEGGCDRGILPRAGGGRGGRSRQIFKFCIPRDAFWCIFREKKYLSEGHCKLLIITIGIKNLGKKKKKKSTFVIT